jgi:hypothetical protein
MKAIHSILAGLLTGVLLSACGGGGSGGGGGTISGNSGLGTTVTAGVSIAVANAPNVGAAVLNGLAAVSGSSNGGASAPPLITGVNVNSSGGRFSLPTLLLDRLARVSDLQNAPNQTGIIGAGVGLNIACTNSGSATVSGVIADPNFMTLAVGDTLSVSFFLCDEIGVKLDGDLDLEVTAIQGGGPFDGTAPFSVTLDVVFSALRALDGSDYNYTDGDMQLMLSDDGAGNIDAMMTGSSLDTSYNDHDQRLTTYTFDVSGNDDPSSVNYGNYSIDLDGTLESRDIDGTVTFMTVTSFTGNEFLGNGDPTAGELLITSDLDVSQERLIAQLDGVNVEFQVDVNGDDVFETTGIFRTWAQLEAL